MILMLSGCDDYERNFNISSLASSPATISGLKARWEFCEKCINNKKCAIYDIKQCKTVMLPDRNNALNVAIRNANIEAVYFLVDVAKTDVNGVVASNNATPLMITAYYGAHKDKIIADFLISRGADVNATRKSTPIDTALLVSIWKNNTDFAIYLLRNGANPSLTSAGEKEGYACVRANIKENVRLIHEIPDCCLFLSKHSGVNKSSLYQFD
jgi:ankyrin repeat protein